MTNNEILVLRNRRTGGYCVKYCRADKRGGELHRTIECKTLDEAKAEAIDVRRRLFTSMTRIIGLVKA